MRGSTRSSAQQGRRPGRRRSWSPSRSWAPGSASRPVIPSIASSSWWTSGGSSSRERSTGRSRGRPSPFARGLATSSSSPRITSTISGRRVRARRSASRSRRRASSIATSGSRGRVPTTGNGTGAPALRARHLLGVAVLGGLLLACARVQDDRGGARVPIDHIVVLFLENRSFAHLFGTYPGPEGLAAYRGKQAGENAVTYATLPRPLGRDGKPDPRFPSDLPNAPFPMLKFVGALDETDNPVHRFYHMQRQYRSEERRVGKECRSRWSPYH